MLVPVLLVAGNAIDYLRYTNMRTEIQAALDGAALAAALPSGKSDDQRAAIAREYFASNLGGAAAEMDELFVKVREDSVEVRITTELETTLMGLGGFDAMRIEETAEVMRPFDGSAEIALVLDYSGSMNKKNKYQDMRTAATTMITNLDNAIMDGKLKVGLVPFSAMVHTEMDRDYVNQASATATWVGCTQDRLYPHNTNVDTPNVSVAASKWGYIDSGNGGENLGSYGCSAYENKKLKIVPLTEDLSSVKTKLADMRPLGNTNIALGAEFGWNLLDPQLPYDEGMAYDVVDNRKFLVLLTDGVQTSQEFGSDNGRSVKNGNDNLVELCDNMRDAGVTVFAIAYDVQDEAVTDLLKDCAPGRYFEPDAGGGEIAQVFHQVTKQIRNQVARLSR